MNHDGVIRSARPASQAEGDLSPQAEAEQVVGRDRTKAEGKVAHKGLEALLDGEKKIMEMIARGDAFEATLEASCQLVEESFPGSWAIILLLDGQRLRRGAAPSFQKYLAEVDGFEIDPAMGTCSRAAALGKQVITTDITTDVHWAGHLDLAARHGLRAGWATPIFSAAGRVLGTFALYWPGPRSPTEHQLQIVNQIARIVALAIERKQAAEALQASEKIVRGQAEALKRTLDALAKESDPNRIMEHVLRTVTAQFRAHSCSVWLRDQVTGLMVFEFTLEDGIFKTKTEAKLAAVSPSLPVEAIPTWSEMFRIQRPIVLEDIRIKPDFPWRGHLLAMGVITMLSVPMVIAGKGEGLIGIRFTQKRTFRDEELDLAQALANQAMLAIQLARLSAQSRQSAIIEERNRMARDIHDTLAQGFTGVILHTEAAEEAMARKRMDVVSGHLRCAGEIARDGLREARRSVQALRPLALERKKLAEAMEEMTNKLTAGTVVKATFKLRGEPRQLPPEWDANILRIGQEVLTNVLRHARASKLQVLLAFDDREVRLNMRDNGCGFDPASTDAGFGLRGMSERAQSMRGRLSIQSATGAGTTISVVLPLKTTSEPETP